MSRLALAGAALLLLGTAAAPFLITAADTPPPTPVAAGDQPAPTPAPKFDLHPEHAHRWITLRWIDGERTAERLRHLPELALLANAAPDVLKHIADLREAVVLLRPDDVLPREPRVEEYDLLNLTSDLIRLTDEPLVQRRGVNAVDRELAESRAKADTAPSASLLASSEGWFTFASPEAQLPVAGILDQGVFGQLACARTAEGWSLGEGGAARLVRDGKRLNLHGTLPQLVPDPLAGPQPPSAADVEIVSWLDTGLRSAPPQPSGTMSFTVTEDGLRFAGLWATTKLGKVAESLPRLDPACLDTVPASALLACAVPLTPEHTADWFVRQVIERELPSFFGRGRATIEAASQAIQQIDGAIVAWVEPGFPIPTVTVEADMPQAAANALIACTGEPRAADGSITVLTGSVQVSLGWQAGRLICTTVPGGLAAIDQSGGFRKQPDVQRALAAMPSKQPNLCAVLRQTALVESVAPFVAMAGPDWAKRLKDYEQRLQQSSSYAYFTVTADAQGVRTDATGLLSLVAGGLLAAIAQSQMHITN